MARRSNRDRELGLWREKDGRKFYKITISRGTFRGRGKVYKMYELSVAEAKRCRLISSGATGMNIGHCVSMAIKYEKDFLSRMCGFRITGVAKAVGEDEAGIQLDGIQVSFYEKRKKKV